MPCLHSDERHLFAGFRDPILPRSAVRPFGRTLAVFRQQKYGRVAHLVQQCAKEALAVVHDFLAQDDLGRAHLGSAICGPAR